MDLSYFLDFSASFKRKGAQIEQNLPRASIYQRDTKSDLEAFLYEPVMCLILQGRKVTSSGDQSVELYPGDAMIVSHDLPILSRITKASPEEPYIAALLSLDLGLIRGFYEQVGEGIHPSNDARALSVDRADKVWLEPFERYLALADKPLDAKVLGPSILREIHYQLLMAPIGGMLRNLITVNSYASRIAKAIGVIRVEFRKKLAVSDIASSAGMSPSSFHEHFKSITGTTPLQYQKDLRLLEARNLLANGESTVSEVAFCVGYESSTHFSRDFSRRFGIAPSKDGRGGEPVRQSAR